MKHWKLWLVAAGLAVIAIYSAEFYFTRWVHYKLVYESQVRSEIREMVKANCLQE